MRLIDWIALSMLVLALLATVWMILAAMCAVRWNRDFAHDKALIKADPSGDLWRKRGKL